MLEKQGLGENCENRGRAVICRGARLRDANWREGSSGRKATGALQWPAKRIIDIHKASTRDFHVEFTTNTFKPGHFHIIDPVLSMIRPRLAQDAHSSTSRSKDLR